MTSERLVEACREAWELTLRRLVEACKEACREHVMRLGIDSEEASGGL